jgi:signal transduction histidine kinase
MGAIFYAITANWIAHDSRQRFTNHAHNAKLNLDGRIKSYNDLLRATASYFQASDLVTRREFHDYIHGLNLPQQYPAAEVINYAAHVLDRDRDEFERRLGAEYGLPRFSIKPPGRRPVYAIITLAEPGTWSHIVGLDLLVRPEPAASMNITRDTGQTHNSGDPIAAITRPNNPGFGYRLPVYRAGMPISNVEQRRAAYIGSLGIAFSMQKLVRGVLSDMPIRGVRMILVDTTPGYRSPLLPSGPGGKVLFDSSGSERQPAPPIETDLDRYFVDTENLTAFNREWAVTFSLPKARFYNSFEIYFPSLAAAVGTISAALLHALFYTLSSSRQRAVAIARTMTRELRESEAKLKLSHQKLRHLAAHAERIKELERSRIAREIHDDLGQNLLALRIEADLLSSRTGGHQPRLHARAQQTLAQIDTTIQSVRGIINNLRPSVLDLGLSAAVEWQIAEFIRRTGIACELIEHTEVFLNDYRATAFFRILQESLANVVRHAHATKVQVDLNLQPDRLSMTISDNGIGIPTSATVKPDSFGLIGIEERMNILHGTFSLNSTPGAGTTISVSVPLDDEHRADEIPAHQAGPGDFAFV